MVETCLGFLADAVLCEMASKTKHFHYLVLVSEFVVVVILSEWRSGPTTAHHYGHIPAIREHYFSK